MTKESTEQVQATTEADGRDELCSSVPSLQPLIARTERGFVGDADPTPISIEIDNPEGGEVRLELAPSEGDPVTAYVDPLTAVVLGERLASAGRSAFDAILEGLQDQ